MQHRKLNNLHRVFILQQAAAFEKSATAIQRKLSDPDAMHLYGFKPVHVSVQRVDYILRHLKPEDILMQREIYLKDYSNIPLAFKKIRILELVKMYEEIADVKMKGVLGMRLNILKQIREEIGEDVEKLIDAIRSVKPNSIINIIGDIGSEENLDKNLSAIFSRRGKSNRFSEN